MSMIRKLTPVAIAIAALCSAPAFAAPPPPPPPPPTLATTLAMASNSQSTAANVSSNTKSSNSATLGSTVLEHASGNVGVNNAAGDTNQQSNTTSIAASKNDSTYSNARATVNNTQAQTQGHSTGVYNNYSENNAELNHDVLRDATGNVGVNNAAGDNNQQANMTSLSVANAEHSHTPTRATANIDSGQRMSNTARSYKSSNKAELEGHALENATGNVGVNNASGSNNQQANGLAIAKADDGAAKATTDAAQMTSSTSAMTSSHNRSSLENDVLENASGNVHVNNASGDNNQQGNFLAIAVTDDNLATALAPSSQSAMNSASTMRNSSNTARMSGEVLQNASGNVGVNNAAGGNNQQLNSLAIANSN